jgi:predicted ester cyclase
VRTPESPAAPILSLPFAGHRQDGLEVDTMDNRKLVEEYFDAFNKADAKRLERLLDASYSFNNPPPGITPDRKGAIEMARLFRKAFPDLSMRLGPWVVEGDRVALRFVASGTHKGEFLGVPATGRKSQTGGLSIVTCRNGKVVEDLTEFDALGLMIQLGAIPAPPQPA